MRMLRSVLATLITLLSCASAFAWGSKGHQIIAYVGASLATEGKSFWQANLTPMQQMSTVPDRVWKSSATKPMEEENHWFQVDYYYTPENFEDVNNYPTSYPAAVNQYSEATVTKNGTAPWRIRQFYQLALNAFKKGNLEAGLAYAGILTHYVGDLSQPLHASENYDGQLTGNKGIHSFFETTVISNEATTRAEVLKRAQKLMKTKSFRAQALNNLAKDLFAEVHRSAEQIELVLRNDDTYGRNAKGAAVQLNVASDRMADGAATLAKILSQLWRESGLAANAKPLSIKDPSFIKPEFSQLK